MALFIATSIRLTLPILLAATGAIFNERSGVINIGIEGMMIAGAFAGAAASVFYGPYIGLLAAVGAALLLALIHAVVTVTFKVDQIVSGVAINILAEGAARFTSISLFDQAASTPPAPSLPRFDLPVLASIPALRPLVRDISPLIPAAFILVAVAWWGLYRTTFGLRLRSVGENPEAAESLGIDVFKMRYLGVLIGGALAGLAGAYLAMEHTGHFVSGMTQGRGFIALAAMIFGNWDPVGALGASLLFGFADAASLRQLVGWIPNQFFQMIPYVLTLLVLAGFVRRAEFPKAVGQPYERD